MSGLALADETGDEIPVRDITLHLNGAGIPVLEKGKHLGFTLFLALHTVCLTPAADGCQHVSFLYLATGKKPIKSFL